MRYAMNRKYPRVYQNNLPEEKETILNISLAAAVGILAFTFVKGMFWGYMLCKKLD